VPGCFPGCFLDISFSLSLFSWSQVRNRKRAGKARSKRASSFFLSLSRRRRAGAQFSLLLFASLLAGGLSLFLLVATAKGRAKLGQSAHLIFLFLFPSDSRRRSVLPLSLSFPFPC
jgi:uncharacterized SAM-binding protein YcdF (DUF218 family)